MRTVRIAWPEGQRHPSIIEETSGFAIQGIRRAVITLEPREAARVDAEIFLSPGGVDIAHANATFRAIHPLEGDLREIKSITFADGSKVDL